MIAWHDVTYLITLRHEVIIGCLVRPPKISFAATLGTKVAIYHFVGSFMLKSIGNVINLTTCAEIVQVFVG